MFSYYTYDKYAYTRTKFVCCQMLFFPEACDYIADSKSQTVEMAESLNGDIMKRYCRAAQESGIWLSIGGFHQKV